jgi:glucose-6-phosphate 1-dehydrogenase
MRGDSELFGRQDIIEAQWRIVEPILGDPPACFEYEPGSWGPEAANALLGAYGPWRDPKPPAKA